MISLFLQIYSHQHTVNFQMTSPPPCISEFIRFFCCIHYSLQIYDIDSCGRIPLLSGLGLHSARKTVVPLFIFSLQGLYIVPLGTSPSLPPALQYFISSTECGFLSSWSENSPLSATCKRLCCVLGYKGHWVIRTHLFFLIRNLFSVFKLNQL